MTLEERVVKLEKQMKRLNGSLLQMQKNQTPQTATLDNTVSGLDAITPYTETKTGYYGEKEKTFYDVPTGNITVLFDNYNGGYTISRIANRVTVSFDEALSDRTNITISVL